jgi:PEP-CTERM motif
MNARLKNSLASGAVAVAALFGAASPAHAIVYVGNWDPDFGSIFTNLGWRGSAEFLLPNACGGLTGTFSNFSSDPCGSYQFSGQNAVVEFYDKNDPLKPTLETLNFGIIPLGIVNSVTLNTPVGGGVALTALTAVNTGYTNRIAATSSVARDPLNPSSSFFFYLKFDGGVASMAYSNQNVPSIDCSATFFQSYCGVSDVNLRPAIRFERVTAAIPEPETYALMLGGLAALGCWVRRRRSA